MQTGAAEPFTRLNHNEASSSSRITHPRTRAMAKFSPWDLLAYDTTTILLGSIAFLLYAIRSWSKPVSLAHPLLLGRQSDISRVRYPGETAAYRNYGAGHGAPVRCNSAFREREQISFDSVCQLSFPRVLEKT